MQSSESGLDSSVEVCLWQAVLTVDVANIQVSIGPV